MRAFLRSIRNNHQACVDRLADPDAAAVMDAHPRRAARGVKERVQDRPVGDGIGTVAHRLRLSVRRRHRTRVEVVAPDHDRRAHHAPRDEIVEREACSIAFAVAQPADARRQALEVDAFARQA